MQAFKLAWRHRKLPDDLPSPMDRVTASRKQALWHILQTEISFTVVLFCALPSFVAVCFPATQAWSVGNNVWHWADQDDPTIDYVRDVAGFYCATFVAGAVVFNRYYYTKRIEADSKRLDGLKRRLRIPSVRDGKPLSLEQFAWTVFWCLMFGVPVFVLGMRFNDFILSNAAAHPWWAEALDPAPKRPSTDFRVNAMRLFTVGWPNKFLGFITALATMRVARAFFLDLQEYFVAKRLKSCPRKPLRWYHPYGFQARFNELKNLPEYAECQSTTTTVVWLRALLWTGAVLTVYGWWLYYYHIPELMAAKTGGAT